MSWTRTATVSVTQMESLCSTPFPLPTGAVPKRWNTVPCFNVFLSHRRINALFFRTCFAYRVSCRNAFSQRMRRILPQKVKDISLSADVYSVRTGFFCGICLSAVQKNGSRYFSYSVSLPVRRIFTPTSISTANFSEKEPSSFAAAR